MFTAKPTIFELAQVLKHLDLSEDDLARLCGVTHWTVTRWLEGRLEIPPHVWNILSLVAGMPHSEVIAGSQMRYEVEEEDIFPNGFDRKVYVRLMRRFHPDLVRKRRNFLGEVLLLNACKDAHDKRVRGTIKSELNHKARQAEA